MIRFAWLQFRMQAALTAAALTIVAVVLALTGPELAHLYDTTVAICAAHHDCSAATTNFTAADGPLQVFSDFLLLVVPLVIGMFWGAPLISREFEAGTFRLAWTQGVTRTRWLAVKLGLGAVASAAIAGLLSLMVSWWSSKLDYVNADPFNSLRFGVRGVVPIGYAAFAFALGLTAGLHLPADAARDADRPRRLRRGPRSRHCLGAPAPLYPASSEPADHHRHPGEHRSDLARRYQGLREHPGDQPSGRMGLFSPDRRPAGHTPTTSFLSRACPLGNYGPLNPRDCTARLAATFHQLVTYQPGSRYWPMQWSELAIFLGLSIVLGGFCFWWIRRPVI